MCWQLLAWLVWMKDKTTLKTLHSSLFWSLQPWVLTGSAVAVFLMYHTEFHSFVVSNWIPEGWAVQLLVLYFWVNIIWSCPIHNLREVPSRKSKPCCKTPALKGELVQAQRSGRKGRHRWGEGDGKKETICGQEGEEARAWTADLGYVHYAGTICSVLFVFALFLPVWLVTDEWLRL